MSMHFYRNKNTYLACVDNLIVSQVDYITKINLCQYCKKHLRLMADRDVMLQNFAFRHNNALKAPDMRQHYPVLLPFLALENLVLKCGEVSQHGKISCIEVQNAARLTPCEALDKDTGNFTVRNQCFLISPQPNLQLFFIFSYKSQVRGLCSLFRKYIQE